MASNAKLAYLLSTCFKVSEGVMKVMTKQYEKSKTLATRHYFTLFINFYEKIDDSNFYISDSYSTFANSKNTVFLDALQYHNDSVLNSNEMVKINDNLIKNNIKLTAYQLVSIYSIATLIKLYKSKGFNYVFVPVCINYGRDSCLLHQTALIIDISQEQHTFIYYEPYGLYEKYDKSYKIAIKTLCECFNGFISNYDIIYTTYHDMMGIKCDGLQKIMLDKNNEKSDEFKNQLNILLAELNKEFPGNQFIGNNHNPDAADTADKTVDVLDVLFKTDQFDISNLSDTKKEIYFRCLNAIITQYCSFNSKTCVSITIVELNEFFKISEKSNSFAVVKETMQAYNSKYKNSPNPNNILMEEIYKMVDLFKHSKKIKDIIGEKKQINSICKTLQMLK